MTIQLFIADKNAYNGSFSRQKCHKLIKIQKSCLSKEINYTMTVRKIGETSVHSPLKRFGLLILAVVFFVSATAFAVPPVMYNVTIYDGSSVTEVLTSKNTADEILKDEGIEINEKKQELE